MIPMLGDGHTLRVDGCDLHYWLIGPETAAVVVFTAGASADRRLFLPQVPDISQRYRMLLWDARGHGLSQPAGELPTAQRVAADLVALLDHLELNHVALVGQSFGGMVSQELISRQPGRIRAAVLLGTTSLTLPLSWRDRVGLALSPWLVRLCPKPLFRRLTPIAVAITKPARRAFREMLEGLSPQVINMIYAGVAASMRLEPGYRLELPVLICHGDKDRLGNIARTNREWSAREPRAELAVIPDAGHNANMDNPLVFNRWVLDFLDRTMSSHAPEPTARATASQRR